MALSPRLRRTRAAVLLVALVALVAMLATVEAVDATAAGTTLYVNRNSSSCTNAGTGTATRPYCSIAAAAADAVAGERVVVAAGTYTGQVVVAHSGTASAPIVFTTNGGRVIVRSGSHGFALEGRDWVTISGFTITGTAGNGIYAKWGSHLRIQNVDVSYSGRPMEGSTEEGIYLRGVVDSIVVGSRSHNNSDAGIYLATDTTRVRVTHNVTYANAKRWARAAPGIDVRGPGNTVDANISHHNEDSGIQIRYGGRNTLVLNDVTYGNGDHGIDVLHSPGQRILNNTVAGNLTSGINVEGYSTGCVIADNISVDNALNSPRATGDIRVDTGSTPHTTADFDLVHLSSSGVLIWWGDAKYSSLAAFRRATGRESRGIEASPRWADPAAGNYHLTAGSPAIDSAVSGAPSLDADGKRRVDVPWVPNTGAGAYRWYDRGAYEFHPAAG